MPEHAIKPQQSTETPPPAPQPQQTTPKPATEEHEDPVSKALDAFARADSSTIEAAASAYVMRTDKGKKQLAGKEDRGISAEGEHQSAAQATIYGRADVVELADQYALLVQAGIIVGGSIKLSGSLEAKYGKLAAKLEGKLTVFGGAFAKVSGSATLKPDSLALQGQASAFAGVKGKGSAALTIDVGSLGVGGELELEGMMGAEAEAEGELSFSKDAIVMSGSVKAFAGIKGEVSGSGTARLYGRDAFKVKAGLTGEVGVGGEVGGGFKIKGGKIEIHLDASGALGLGGGGEIDMTADLKPVAVWAWRQFDKAKWSINTGKGADILDHPTKIVGSLTEKVAKYSQMKIDALALHKAENFVKIEKLQAYVGEVMPRKQVKGRPNASAIDACIKQAIEDGLRTTTKVANINAIITDGKIMKLENLPEPDDLTARLAPKSKTGKALTSIVATDMG